MPRFEGVPIEQSTKPRFAGTPVDGYDANQTLDPELLASSRPKPPEFGVGGKGAGFGALVKAGTVDDPQTKINVFAKSRGISPDRYSVVDGDIFYEGDDGKLYPESPSGVGGFGKELAANTIANAPAIALSTGGSIAGGILGAPGGPAGVAAGAVVGSGVGGAAGEGYRKTIGALAFDEPQTVEGNVKAMGKEGALAMAGEGIGRLASKGFKEVKLRRNVRDIDRLNQVAIGRVQELADKYKVQLTPAEMTGLRSLINQQWYLSNAPDSADTIVSFMKNREPELQRAMYEYFDTLSKESAPYNAVLRSQNAAKKHVSNLKLARKEATEALYKQAMRDGSEIDVTDAIMSIYSGVQADPGSPGAAMANKIIKRVVGEPAQGKATVSYSTVADAYKDDAAKGVSLSPGKASYSTVGDDTANSFNVITGTTKKKASAPISVSGSNPSYSTVGDAYTADAGRGIKVGSPQGAGGLFDKFKRVDASGNVTTKITAPLSRLHAIKVELDAALGAKPVFQSSKEAMERGYLEKMRDQIVTAIEAQSDTYAKAKGVFAEMSKPINAIEEGLMGGFVQADSEQAQRLATRLFESGSSSPQAVAEAKKIISSVDPEGWNGMVRAYAQRKLEDGLASLKNRAIDSDASNVGGAFIKFDKRLMKSALDPDQVKALDDIDFLLRQTTKSFKGNSITVPALGIAREVKEDAMAAAGPGAKAAMALPKLTQAPSRFLGWLESSLEGDYQANLAKIITDKNSMKELRKQTMKLREVGPVSQKYFPALSSAWSVVLGNPLPTESENNKAGTK